jgi:hypothetical protein
MHFGFKPNSVETPVLVTGIDKSQSVGVFTSGISKSYDDLMCVTILFYQSLGHNGRGSASTETSHNLRSHIYSSLGTKNNPAFAGL